MIVNAYIALVQVIKTDCSINFVLVNQLRVSVLPYLSTVNEKQLVKFIVEILIHVQFELLVRN